MRKIYLDYAASTPVDPYVIKTIQLCLSKIWGNPNALHSFGQDALKIIDEARETSAKSVGADFREIIFTGSATEANNLALRGAVKKYISDNQLKISENQRPRLIISAIEHESILETARDLEKEGVEVIYLNVDSRGLVDLWEFKKSLNENTILVSIMYANNEIGVIQPINEISRIIAEFRKKKLTNKPKNQLTNQPINQSTNQPINQSTIYPLFHTDAVQAFQYLNCDVNKLGVDLMTLSGHKICGPKGIGVLYIKKPINQLTNQLIKPIITGGGQEFGLRSGTQNVPAIVGFAKAVELVMKNKNKEVKRIRNLSNYFWRELKKIYPAAKLNNPSALISFKSLPADRQEYKSALPNILNVYFPKKNNQDLLLKLDLAGVAVSAGSACLARALKPSYVLKALGLNQDRIQKSLRFSFGRFTTKEELKEALNRIKKVLAV